MKCLLYSEKTPRHQQKVRKKTSTDAIIVKQESHSDLLKTVKDKIKSGSAVAESIKTIRKSKDGNMVLTVTERLRRIFKRKLDKETSKLQASYKARNRGIMCMKWETVRMPLSWSD